MAQDRGDFTSSLHTKGMRVTGQRKLILQVLEEAGGHLDAETVFERAHSRDERVSLATVYRTLQLLKEMGLVDQHYVSRQHEREVFEPVGAEEHYHFSCLKCGKVVEFQSPLIDHARQQLTQELGINILHGCACFEGYCADCSQRGEAETRG
jgi:Fur family transcriptional regulator, ferric uptake regulator